MRGQQYNGIILESHKCKCFLSVSRYDNEELSAIHKKQEVCNQKRFKFNFFQTHDVAQTKQNSPAGYFSPQMSKLLHLK